MSMNTVPERLAALREAMKANGVDVYLIPVGDPHASEYMPDHYTALTYFSGFHGENSNFVVTMTGSAVWADGRYFVQAEKEIAGTEIQLQKMGEPGVPTVEEYCAKVLPEDGKLVWQRVMRTKPSPNYDAGDRTGRLPEVIPLDFPSFMKAFNNTAAGAAASAARPKPEPTASAAAKPQQ